MKKKILSVILSVALLAGTVLIPSNEPMVVTAIETEEETTPETNTATEGENTASVESTPTLADESYFTYIVENGEATITDVDTAISGAIIIPDTLGGYPVTSIASYAFQNCSHITSLIIPAGVTEIGEGAFKNCNEIATVTFEEGINLTSISNSVFSDCTSLVAITIPASVQSIGSHAFSRCLRLSSVTFEKDSNLTTIWTYAFVSCDSLTAITIPASVTTIYSNPFEMCSSLESITVEEGNRFYHSSGNCLIRTASKKLIAGCKSSVIPADDTVTSIGSAFFSCDGLASITIPNGVTSIDNLAFHNCQDLTSVIIPNTMTSIGSCAFNYCIAVETVYYGGTLAEWDAITFEDDTADPTYYGATLICLGDSDPCANGHTFGDWVETKAPTYTEDGIETRTCVNDPTHTETRAKVHPDLVEEWSCGANVTARLFNDPENTGKYILYIFGAGAMTGYTSNSNAPWYSYRENITTAKVCDGVTSIGSFAFYYCTSLTSITIPDSVTSVGDYAFEDCTGLTSITIPDSVTSIGSSAFYGCTGLTSITIPDSVTSIGSWAFSGCKGLTSITIPDSVTSIGSSAFKYCTGLTSITIPDSVTSIGDDAFSGCTGLTSITIPDSVTRIGESVFQDCTGLTSITIPDSVTSIGYMAFYNCTGLTSITIPDSVTSIGSYAFAYCRGLTSITIPDSVTSIGDYAFEYCTGLISITIPDSVTSIGYSVFYGCTGLTSITIPDSATGIGSSAFYDCTGLTSITIPDSVTRIGDKAFYDCTAIKTVYYEGTRAEWDAIDFMSETSNPTYYGAELICLGEDSCANGHTYGDWVETKAPTYTEDGIETRTCVNNPTHTETRTKVHPDLVEEWSCGTNVTARLFPDPKNVGMHVLHIFGTGEMMDFGSSTDAPWDTYRASITSITVCSGVTSIGDQAFIYCTRLTSIEIPASVTSVGFVALAYCPELASIIVEKGNKVYHSTGNCLITANKVLFVGCKNSVIPSDGSVTGIVAYAFEGCKGLASIEIPSGVTSIGFLAFSNCTGLTSIKISESVTNIGWNAFYGCTAIETVYYEGTRAEWNAITFEDETANPTYYGAELICLGDENSCANGHKWHGGNCYTPAVCERCGEKAIIHGHNLNPAECNKPSKCQNPGCHYTASGALGHNMTKATCTEPAHCTREGCDHTAGKAKGHKWGEWVREGNIETRVCKNDPTHIETREVEEIKPDKGHREEPTPRPNDDKHPYKAGATANKNVTASDVDTNSDSILLEVKLNISEEVVASTVGITADLLNALDGKEFAVGTDVGSLALDAVAAAKLASKNADVSVSLENITNAEETAAGKVVIAINITANGEELLPPDESAENGMLTVTVQYKKGLRIDQVAVSYLAEDGTRETVNVIDYDPVSGLVTFETAHLSDYEISEVNYYTYTELNGGAYITKVDIAITGDVVIPDTIDGLPVIRIGAYAFENCTGITSITLPESLAKLGKYAFAGCTSLEAVIFAENGALTEISDFAFKGCTSLKAVAIPAGVKTIGSNAFFGCESLTAVTIPEGVTSIGKYAFAYCTSLASLILPEGLASIGAFAFTGCTALEAIILPESVTAIEKRAFAGCTSLVSVTLPKTVTAIGEYAFYNCAILTAVTLEEGSALAEIGANAFRACATLSALALPAGVTVGANAFYGTPLAN